MKFHVIHIRKKIPYYLHVKVRTGAGKYFYFSPSDEGSLDKVPDGYEISMNPKTKQPIIRKKRTLQ